MSFRLTHLAAATAVLFASTAISQAGPVWTIDSNASGLSLSIPDQSVALGDVNANIRIRNQSNNGAWNQGRTAPISGTINSNYSEGSSFKIIPGGTVVALETGNYRPSAVDYVKRDGDGNITHVYGGNEDLGYGDSINPDGTAEGGDYEGSTQRPAAWASRINANALLFFNFNLGYMSMYDVTLANFMPNAASLITVNPNTFSFASGLVGMGIETSTMAIDGLFAGSPINSQPIPDTIIKLDDVIGMNQTQRLTSITPAVPVVGAPVATIVKVDPINDPLLRRLTIPIFYADVFDLDGSELRLNLRGQIVAYAYVPEPSTLMMAGIGIVGLLACARRKLRRA